MKKLKEEQDKRREHLALGHGQYRYVSTRRVDVVVGWGVGERGSPRAVFFL